MAICRAGNFSVDDFMEVTAEFMHSKLVGKIMSGSDLNKQEDINKMSAQMHRIAEWANEHPEYKDKTWDFNFDETLHKDGFYYHFTRCPMEKFAQRPDAELRRMHWYANRRAVPKTARLCAIPARTVSVPTALPPVSQSVHFLQLPRDRLAP